MNEENQQKTHNTESENQTSLQQINHELGFNIRAISSVAERFVEQLSKAQSDIQAILTAMQETVNKHEKAVGQITTEVRILCMLPDKIQSRLDSIVPQIASEVKQIHQPRILEITDQFTSLSNKLTEDIANYENQLERVSNNCTEQLSSTTKRFSVTLEEKLNQFTDKLTTSSGLATTANSKTLLKNLAFVIIFSALVSGITSYVVTTKFPRFVAITGANNLSIHDSRVEVWNSKKELDTKGHPNTRKFKN